MNLAKKYKQLFEGKVRSNDNTLLSEALARGLKPLLTIGSTIKSNVGENALLKLSDKFEDIDDEQADDIASHLNMAIELIQDRSPSEARGWLKKFNNACKDALKGKPTKSAFENNDPALATNDTITEDLSSSDIKKATQAIQKYVKRLGRRANGEVSTVSDNIGQILRWDDNKIKQLTSYLYKLNKGSDQMVFEGKLAKKLNERPITRSRVDYSTMELKSNIATKWLTTDDMLNDLTQWVEAVANASETGLAREVGMELKELGVNIIKGQNSSSDNINPGNTKDQDTKRKAYIKRL